MLRADLVARWPRAFLDFVPYEFIGEPRSTSRRRPMRRQLSSSGQSRLFEWLLTVVCRAAAERPVIWLIEDIQWADRSTLDLIGFLGSQSEYRASRRCCSRFEPTTSIVNIPLRRWLSELERLDAVTRVNLGRLTRTGHRRPAATISPPDPRSCCVGAGPI